MQAFILGFFTSMQYTSMNTLVYADVSGPQTSGASTIAATGQQLAISFGVAGAALIAAIFVPPEMHSHPDAIIHGAQQAFLALGILTVLSSVVFMELEGGRRRGHEPPRCRPLPWGGITSPSIARGLDRLDACGRQALLRRVLTGIVVHPDRVEMQGALPLAISRRRR